MSSATGSSVTGSPARAFAAPALAAPALAAPALAAPALAAPALATPAVAGRRAGADAIDTERGGLSLMVVVLFVALVSLAGIVVDGGAKLTADENATAVAQEAARAGATTVNQSQAYTAGTFVVDQQQAVAAARAYLSAAGYRQYTVSPDGIEAIHVTVSVTEPTRFLSMIGIDSFTSTGTATASLVTGITGGR